MKNIVYIITDSNRVNLHVGTSSNLLKTLNFYREIPSLYVDINHQTNRLVYYEEFDTERDAMIRFVEMNKFTRAQKEKIVRSRNPNWADLTISRLTNQKNHFPIPTNQLNLRLAVS